MATDPADVAAADLAELLPVVERWAGVPVEAADAPPAGSAPSAPSAAAARVESPITPTPAIPDADLRVAPASAPDGLTSSDSGEAAPAPEPRPLHWSGRLPVPRSATSAPNRLATPAPGTIAAAPSRRADPPPIVDVAPTCTASPRIRIAGMWPGDGHAPSAATVVPRRAAAPSEVSTARAAPVVRVAFPPPALIAPTPPEPVALAPTPPLSVVLPAWSTAGHAPLDVVTLDRFSELVADVVEAALIDAGIDLS